MDWNTLAAGVLYTVIGAAAIAAGAGLIDAGPHFPNVLLGLHAAAHAILRTIAGQKQNGKH